VVANEIKFSLLLLCVELLSLNLCVGFFISLFAIKCKAIQNNNKSKNLSIQN
jgi:hypothetical protein